ncbi:MAG: hypothetical protein GXO69_03635 [Acidobacteria bacterium]|nr:hypothetical protein [Acidobacteriota bacterium]
MDGIDIQLVRGKLKTAVLMWFSFVASTLIYAGLVEWMQRSGVPAVAEGRLVHTFLLGAAVLCFFSAGIAKTILLRVPGEKPVWNTEKLTGRLLAASMVALALSETICLLGLVEYFVFRNYDSFYLFFIISLFAMILNMPRYPKWRSYLERMSGAALPEELQ